MTDILRRFLLVPLLAMGAGASAVAACTVQGDAGSGYSDNEVPGGSDGGGPTGDGSINVENDADPAPGAPLDYSHLCGANELGRVDDESCLPESDSDPCVDVAPSDDAGSTAPSVSACQLISAGEGAIGKCSEAVGAGVYASPCQSAADCSTGLGCVPATVGVEGNDYGGACRDYCCGDVEACPKSTFCAPQPMSEDTAVDIPVCIPATNCTLLAEGACDEGLACTIVRSDGTTSCVVPGEGIDEADPPLNACPCADGYMCAKHVNECKKLCHTDKPLDCPTGSTCQGGSMEFPEGFGVCVGTDSYK
jgi:hypothetical protein